MRNRSVLQSKKRRLPLFDIPFLIGVLCLLAVGLLMLYSAGFASAYLKQGDSYYYIRRQLLFAGIGMGAMIGISFIPTVLYRRFVWLLYFVSVALLVLVLVIPTNDSEHRWLYFGGIQFQPSEIAKVAVVLTLADYLSRHKEDMSSWVWGFIVPGCIIMIPTALVAVETHLSGAILIGCIGFTMLLCGGFKLKFTLITVGVAVPAVVAFALSNNYMLRRITTWLNPESDILGDGWQVYQSMITMGSGGLFGLGYGKSKQKYLYMSEPQNDFIFSIVCEEIGYIGALFVIALFVFLIWRGIHIAMHSPNLFSSLVVIGISTRVLVQVVLNLAVVSNSVPVTGISLPFFSYGGTALVVLLGEMGLVLQISRYSSAERGTTEGLKSV